MTKQVQLYLMGLLRLWEYTVYIYLFIIYCLFIFVFIYLITFHGACTMIVDEQI